MNLTPKQIKKAKDVFRRHNGVLRTSQALKAGIHSSTLYAMRDSSLIETLGRGMYRLVDLPPLGNPDLVTVALKVPNGVICLISALSFHDITTQVPHQVYVALGRGAEPSRIQYPPIRTIWFSGPAFTEGVETHRLDGVPVQIYCVEKTLADCFKYRNKIGLDIAIEALRMYKQRKKLQVDALIQYARVCRVEKVMRPYLEATMT